MTQTEAIDQLTRGQEAIGQTLEATYEQLQVVVAQNATIIRLLTEKAAPKEGPTIEEILQALVRMVAGQNALLTEVRDGQRELLDQREGHDRVGAGARGTS